MKKLLLLLGCLLTFNANAVIIPDFFDQQGQPLHTQDEFDLQVTAQVQQVAQGYQYTYTVYSLPSSIQTVDGFSLRISFDAVVAGSSVSPWMRRVGYEPEVNDTRPMMSWGTLQTAGNPDLLYPSTQATGFSFISPYPPGIVIGYAAGISPSPDYRAPNYPDTNEGLPEYDGLTPYGPGKVFPVVGPVKPMIGTGGAVSPYNNVTVQQCMGLFCTVQLSAIGPQDPYGIAYTYTWSSGFGTVPGINPTLQLPVGTNPVTLTVSDPYGTVLTTATMDITVVDPTNVAVGNITPAQAAVLTPVQLAALTPTQVSSVIALLSPRQIAVLTANQLSSLTPAQINSVSAWLSPSQLSAVENHYDRDDDESDDKSDDEDRDKDDKDDDED